MAKIDDLGSGTSLDDLGNDTSLSDLGNDKNLGDLDEGGGGDEVIDSTIYDLQQLNIPSV